MPRETRLNYEQFLEEVEGLDFIQDRQTADAANKSVIGILISRLGEKKGRFFADMLPYPLSYDKLRDYGTDNPNMSLKEYVLSVAFEFGLDYNEARELIDTVLLNIREYMDLESLREIEDGLSDDWIAYLDDLWQIA